MKKTNATDAARVELLLAELRLPAMKLMWADLAARADQEGWPASRFLAALAEHEIADRGRRRIQRRMGLRHVTSTADYVELLRSDREEVQNLFKDLLIGVTAFFREPDAWRCWTRR